MDRKKVSSSQTLDLKEAVAYISSLLEAFKKGTITVSKGGESVVLQPASPVFLEIEAKKKKDKERFSFELSWHTECCPDEDDDTAALTISSTPPPPAEKAAEGVKSADGSATASAYTASSSAKK